MCRCVWINPASSEDWGSPVIQAQQMRYDCSSSLCNCQMQCIRDTHKFVQSPFFTVVSTRIHLCGSLLFLKTVPMISCLVCTKGQNVIFSYIYIYIYIHTHTHIYIYIYRVSHEEYARLRKGVPYVKVYRYNPKHLCPKLDGYGDNGQRSLKLWQLLHTYWLPNTY